MNRPHRTRLAALLLAQIALAASAQAQTTSTWDNGGADNNINTAANWNLDTLPAFTSASQALFSTASTVNVNVDATFGPLASPATPAVAFSGNFTLGSGGGSLVLFATNTGATPVLRANTGSSATVINAPVRIITSPASAPRGNLLTLHVNNTTATNTGLTLTGGISRDPASTGAATYDLRFTSAGAKARLGGPISGLGTLVNNQSGTNNWAGDLIIAGNQTLTSSSNITFTTGTTGIPTDSGRLILGETTDDLQAWNNITLNNKIKLAIGGNITANVIASAGNANATITRIVGYTASNSTLSLNSGTVSANMTIGGNGTYENNLHLVKASSGTLTLNGTHSYVGNTTVSAGTLTLNGSIVSPIIVNAGATLSGEGVTTGSLTFAPGASTLSFDPVTQTAALSAASLSAAGSSVVVSPSASLTNGTAYTVLKLTGGTFPGSPSDFFLLGARGGSLSYTANSTELTLTGGASTPATLKWTGAHGTKPTFWDAATTVNWSNSGSPDRYYAGDNVIFDDTASSTAVSIETASVSPTSITFNNTSAKNYTLSGGVIGGSTSLTKSGNGTLSLSTTGASTFTGGVVLNDGALEFTALNQLGATTTAAQLNGGTLRFNGASTVTGNLPLTIGGDTTLDFNSNATITVRIGGKISGAGNITKSGAGILALGQSSDTSPGNDFTGTLTVTGGTLDVRHADSLGATSAGTSIQSATLLLQNFGQTSGSTLSYAEPLAFSGPSYLTMLNQIEGSTAKDFTNQFTGAITIGGNSTLNVATAVSSSAVALRNTVLAFTSSGSITTGTGSTLAFGSRPTLPVTPFTANQTITVAAPISGNGSIVVDAGAGSVITFNAPHTYTGATSVLGGTLRLASDSLPSTTTLTIASSGATLALDASDTVNKLYIGSTQQNAGTYGATGSGATTINDTLFTGTGTLTVTTGPIVDLYAAWASTNSLTGNDALKTADPDADGLINLLEYATGTSPTTAGGTPGFSVAPSGNFLALTYTRVADPTLTYTVKGSSDLTGAWSTIAVTDNPSTGTANVAGNVTITDTTAFTGGKRFLRLEVTQP